MSSSEEKSNQGMTFAEQAARPQAGFFGEFWHFLRNNKKWWITPIVVILLGFGVLVLLGSSAIAPFIYTLF
jgi:hypothetical protein